jgi:hypothetical protein
MVYYLMCCKVNEAREEDDIIVCVRRPLIEYLRCG